jgi:hypothetical protein
MLHITQHRVMEGGALSSEMQLAKWSELVQGEAHVCLMLFMWK